VFTVIPVVDIRNGLAVRARAGDRANYRPLASPLVKSPQPVEAVRGLLGLHPFRALYVADLDAIERGAANAEAVAAMAAAAPGTEIWLDAGFATEAAAVAALGIGAGRVVIGSESQRVEDPGLARRLADAGRPVALSLDFRDGFVGPPALAEDPALWPGVLIVMTLARVGSAAGPDLDRLRSIRERAGERRVYAAGGVRGAEDLEALAAAGMAGVLVASALHDGWIAAGDLARYA
jgi:phosphoribosylformimino-5-aminoimidazole carboxamide ribotide isomerase